MAQETFFDEDLDFGVEASQADAKEFEAYMDGTPAPSNTSSDKIKPATDKDKQEAADKGKAKSDEERAVEMRAAKRKEEDDARKFIEGNDDDAENDDDNGQKSQTKKSTNEDDNNDEESDNDFESLAKDLYKVGIFTPDGEDEELPATSEEFLSLIHISEPTRPY